MRQTLVETALELIDERGVDDLSLRELARKAGVSSGAPFRHFADKTALFAAVAEDAQRSFLEHTQEALRKAGNDPVARFQAVGVAFVEFAVAHPARFRVMHLAGARQVGGDELAELRAKTRDILRSLVVDGQKAGRLPRGNPAPLMLTAYAMAYGLSRIFVDGLAPDLGVSPEHARKAARAVTGWLGRGLALKE